MPLLGKGGLFRLKLYNCQTWQTLPDLTATLYSLQKFSNLIAQTYPVSRSGQPAELLTKREDFEAYCKARYRESEDWDQEHFEAASPQGDLSLRFVSTFTVGGLDNKQLLIDMSASKFGGVYNSIEFLALLSSRTIPISDVMFRYREDVMQLYVDIGQYLIETLSPDYFWIAEDDEYAEHLHGRDILAHRIKTLYWANYFSSDYLDKQTQSLILNAPVGISKHLSNGIWYQLHEQFETVDTQTVERIEAEAASWFSELGLDRVQWRYHII